MRSLIIIEVEHGETTDGLAVACEVAAGSIRNRVGLESVKVNDWTVKVDIPECFVLDKPHPPTCILTGAEGENPDDCTTHDHESL